MADLITFLGGEYGDDKDDLYPPEIWHDQTRLPLACLTSQLFTVTHKQSCDLRPAFLCLQLPNEVLIWSDVRRGRHWLVLLEAYLWNCGTLNHPLCAHAVKAYSCINGVQVRHIKRAKKGRIKKTPPAKVFFPDHPPPSRAIWKQGFNEEVESTNCRIATVKVRRGVAQEEDIMGHKITANNPARNVRLVVRIYGRNFFWNSRKGEKIDEESCPRWHFAALSWEVRALGVLRVFVLTRGKPTEKKNWGEKNYFSAAFRITKICNCEAASTVRQLSLCESKQARQRKTE